MDTYSLICEGRCNPAVKALDSLVAEQALHIGMRRSAAGWSQDLFHAQRRLTYTAHFMVGTDQARCEECAHLRQYGNSVVSFVPFEDRG